MLNKVILIGNVGRDPEVRYFDNGVAKAQFSLATTETYKNKEGQRVDQTEWHNVVTWRKSAEFVEKYVKKGDKMYVEGKIKTRSYDDKDGVKKYITEIWADNMQFVGGRKQDDQGASQPAAAQAASPEAKPAAPAYQAPAQEPGDDLPF